MAQTDLIQAVAQAYADIYGQAPEATAYAPGRVNLLGEHTDYNGGFVLPMPLSLGTAVAIGRIGAPGEIQISSTAFEGTDTRSLDDAPSDKWSDYVLGSLIHLLEGQNLPTGLAIMVATDLPVGSGLSSSAALEVATMRAAAAIFQLDISPKDMAILARKAENQFMGVPCGIMDQFSVSVGTPGAALFLDTRSLDHRPVTMPASHHVVVVHSGVGHKNNDGGYQQRVAECTAASEQLGVTVLSDLGLEELEKINALPAPLDGRARHIVTENARVAAGIQALADGDTDKFGTLMNESHASQRDDYAVSLPPIDALVSGAHAAGATGVRLTGGGFGGAIVAFVAKDRFADWRISVETDFPAARVLAIT